MAPITESEIAQTQPASFQTGQVATVSAAHMVHDTYTAFLPPLLPSFIDKLSLSTTQAGILAVFLQAPSLLQPFIGHLSDHISLRYLVILAPAVTATAMSLLGIAPGYVIIAFLLTLAGLSSASLHAVAPVIAGRLSGKNLGRGMGFWMVGGELGRTLGPIVIVSAVGAFTLEGSWWLMIFGWLTSLVLYWRLRSVPGRPPESGAPLPFRPALTKMAPLLWPLAIILFLSGLSLAVLTTYLPVFMTGQGANLWLAGASLSILEAGGVVGALFAGSLSDWLGRRQVLAASLFSTGLLMFALLASTGVAQYPLLLVTGFASLSVTPVLMALVQESYPESRALANGIYMAISFILRSIAVILVGVMADHIGLHLAFQISAAILFLTIPAVFFLPKRVKA